MFPVYIGYEDEQEGRREGKERETVLDLQCGQIGCLQLGMNFGLHSSKHTGQDSVISLEPVWFEILHM